MKQFFNIIILLLIYSPAFSLQKSNLKERIFQGTELAYNDNLLEALDYFQELETDFPDHPLPLFFQIAIIEKIQVDYMTDYGEKEFLRLLKKGTQIAEEFHKVHPDEPEGHFYLGGIIGYSGLHTFRTKNAFSVFMDVLSAVRHIKKAYALNPDLWDIYYGLGCYYYWKAVKAPFLYVFGGRQKDKNQGLDYLRLVSEKGIYAKSEARSALVRALVNEKLFDEALRIVDEDITQYPRSVVRLRFRLEINALLNKWLEVYEDSQRIEKLLSEKSFTGTDAWIHLYYFKGLSALELGKTEEAEFCYKTAVRLCSIHGTESSDNVHKVGKAKKTVKKLEKIKKEKFKELLWKTQLLIEN